MPVKLISTGPGAGGAGGSCVREGSANRESGRRGRRVPGRPAQANDVVKRGSGGDFGFESGEEGGVRWYVCEGEYHSGEY